MCGEEWLNCYLDTSSEKEQKKTICKIWCVNVEADVVKSEIPLLLSKNSINKANTKIDFATN